MDGNNKYIYGTNGSETFNTFSLYGNSYYGGFAIANTGSYTMTYNVNACF